MKTMMRILSNIYIHYHYTLSPSHIHKRGLAVMQGTAGDALYHCMLDVDEHEPVTPLSEVDAKDVQSEPKVAHISRLSVTTTRDHHAPVHTPAACKLLARGPLMNAVFVALIKTPV